MIGERPKLFWQTIDMAFLIGGGETRAIGFSLVAALLRLPFRLQTTGSVYPGRARAGKLEN